MSIFEILSTFTFYGIDVAALAFLTVAFTQLIKKTLFRHAQKKLVTFLPFAIGTIFYAAYAAVKNWSVLFILKEYVSIMEHGFSVGAAATLYYVMYEQFVRQKSGLSTTEKIIATLIESYVPDNSVEAAAKAVAHAIERDVTGNGALRAQELLAEFTAGQASERDLQLLSKLIIETLARSATK